MPNAPSWSDYFSIGRAEAAIRRPDLMFAEGDISEMEMAGAAAMADHLTGWAAGRFRATFLDGATGDDLTALCDDHWQVKRLVASKAQVPVRFTRLAAPAAGIILTGTTVATQADATGREIRFVTDADIPVGIGVLVANGTATAAEAGAAGNVIQGAIQKISGALFDTFTVTNPAAAAGGNEKETDDELRERTRLRALVFLGTLYALEYGAQTVPGVRKATATEDPQGICTLYVSDASGNSTQPMINAVVAILPDWKAAGAIVNVTGGIPILVPIQIALTVRAGVDIPALVADIKNAIVARINRLQIGQILTRDMIRSAAIAVAPADIDEVTVIAPGANVAPGGNGLIKTNAGLISVS